MTDFLLKEDGSYLLLETADKIILERQARGIATNRQYATNRRYATNRQRASSRLEV